MKKLIILIVLGTITLSSQAQSDRYNKAMADKIAAMDSANKADVLRDLSASFERIAEAEKTQWQPYYYAAYTQIMSAYFMMEGNYQGGLASVLDPVADKAEKLIQKAEELNKESSEIYIIKKMIASVRMMADPMSRYMQYGTEAAKMLEKAKQLDPENPRVYLLEGQDKFYTPEQFGGSKTEAKKLFELAVVKFENFKPKHAFDPSWGQSSARYFLSQFK